MSPLPAPSPIGQSLHLIYEVKRRRYTLIVLAVLACLVAAVTIAAFAQGVVIRQILNSTVLAVIITCGIALYRSKEKLLWPTRVTVIVLNLIATSGFISNGGVLYYSLVILPMAPILTALLLGRRAATVSCIYILCLCLISVVLTLNGQHPSNITPVTSIPYLAAIFAFISIIVVYISFNSLLLVAEQSEKEVIGHLKTLEEETSRREVAEQNARVASEAKVQFLSTISHELRTPLNAISGFNQILAKQALSDKSRRCVDNIGVSSSELLTKINDLLEFTELFSEKVSLTCQPCLLEDIFEVLRHAFTDPSHHNQNKLTFNTKNTTGLQLNTDISKLKRAISIVIDNALKFTNKGEVTVHTEVTEKATGMSLTINVIDNGIGIREDRIEHMFDVFTQQDMSSSRSYEGIGLGLATCYHLIQLLGGTLTAINNAEQGSTFSISLPL